MMKVHKAELIPQSSMLATGERDPLKLGVDERRFSVFYDPAIAQRITEAGQRRLRELISNPEIKIVLKP
jgi:hypothetical protein